MDTMTVMGLFFDDRLDYVVNMMMFLDLYLFSAIDHSSLGIRMSLGIFELTSERFVGRGIFFCSCHVLLDDGLQIEKWPIEIAITKAQNE